MKKLAIILLLSLVCFGCASTRLFGPETYLVADRNKIDMSRSVFMVVAESENNITSRGSAFAMIYNGKLGIMTAWHVFTMSKAKFLKIHGNGKMFKCGPFIQLGDNDIGWCETPIPEDWVPLIKAAPSFNYGTLITWGFPYTEEKLTNYIGEDNGPSLFKTDHNFMIRRVIGKAVQGMSGGPVVNSDGEVVAVVSYTGWPTQNYHYPVLVP